MSKIRVISNPMQRGRNGANTYYVTKGQQVVRPSRNNSNYGEQASRSPAQQARRILWSNPVNFYKISSFWMTRAFESKEQNQSDYNKFMSLNIDRSVVAFAKQEAAQSPCVAEAFRISQGSIPSIVHYKNGEVVMSSVEVGVNITSSSALQDVINSIIEKNPGIDKSYQLSLIVYQQSIDADNIPHLNCYAYELSLNDTSAEKTLADIFPVSIVSQVSGFLTLSLSGYTGGATFIWSRTDATGRIKVSSQELIVHNDYLLAMYTSEEQYTKAAESYGVDIAVFLAAGVYSGGGTVPATIQSWGALWAGSAVIRIGGDAPQVSFLNSYDYWELFKLAPIPAGSYSADVYLMKENSSLEVFKITVSGTLRNASGGSVYKVQDKLRPDDESFNQVVRIDVRIGGQIYRALFQRWTA